MGILLRERLCFLISHHTKFIHLKSKNMFNTQKIILAMLPFIALLLFSNQSIAQSKVIDVESFNKIIVSPHIEVVFKEGKKESVSIESISIPMKKLNVEVKNNTLNVYLEGAKITSPNKKDYINGYKRTSSLYKGTIVKAIITYKNINSIDLRGEQKFVFEDKLSEDKLRMKIFGEAEVCLNEVDIQNLQLSVYGENHLKILKGKIANQKITSYGESEINITNVDNMETRLTSYGEGTFDLNVSGKLKITSFGEATINYSGSPNLNKGLVIGETEISNVD